MMMLRQHQDACASAPRMAHGRADDMVAGRRARQERRRRPGDRGARPGAPLRRFHRRGQHLVRGGARRDLRPAGPNGAGKTTTFRMLWAAARHQRPSGSGGPELRTARAQARGRIGYVSQKFALYGNLTVRENLEFFGGAYGLRGQAWRQRVAAMVDQFGLTPAVSGLLPVRLQAAPGHGGRPAARAGDPVPGRTDQRHRPLARRAFWRAITALAQSGVTIVITTHFMEEAEYCDRIAIQDAGRMPWARRGRYAPRPAGGRGRHEQRLHRHRRTGPRPRRRRPGMSGSDSCAASWRCCARKCGRCCATRATWPWACCCPPR